MIRADWVEREVLQHIHAFLDQPKLLQEARKQALGAAGQDRKRLEEDKRRLHGQIAKIRDASLRWSRRYNEEEEDISREAFQQLDQQYQQELGEAQEALAHVEQQLSEAARGTEDWTDIERALSDMKSLWEQLTPHERKQSRIEAEALFLPIRGRINGRPADEPLLSPREQEALAAIDGGETYEALGKRLARSKASLYNMVYNARRKLREAQEREPEPPASSASETVLSWQKEVPALTAANLEARRWLVARLRSPGYGRQATVAGLPSPGYRRRATVAGLRSYLGERSCCDRCPRHPPSASKHGLPCASSWHPPR